MKDYFGAKDVEIKVDANGTCIMTVDGLRKEVEPYNRSKFNIIAEKENKNTNSIVQDFIQMQVKFENECCDKAIEELVKHNSETNKMVDEKYEWMRTNERPLIDLKNPNTLLDSDWIGSEPCLLPGDIVRVKETGNLMVIVEGQRNENRLPQYSARLIKRQNYKGEKYAWWKAYEFSEVVELAPLHGYVH